MFVQPVTINTFVYFGTIISEGELKTAMKRSGYKDTYAFVYSNKLEYKRLGDAKKSNRFIIGKEINAQYAFTYMKLDMQNGMSLCNNDDIPFPIKLEYDEEILVKQRLYQCGVFGLANYYLCFNYEKNS